MFPSTYLGGVYATEKRLIDGDPKPCVLLDSVASQANRMEAALQDALDKKDGERIEMPVVTINIPPIDCPGGRRINGNRITSLQAPHRIADALFRESNLNGTPFRESNEGKYIFTATQSFATPLFEYCPTALLFGMWDSTGLMGGLGTKFERVITSEIIGVNAIFGVGTSSRLDPAIPKTEDSPIYEHKNGGWTLDEKEAKRDKEDGPPRPYKEKGKLSKVNLGNVAPVVTEYKDDSQVVNPHTGTSIQKGQVAAAGATIDYAEQTCVISLAALRKLHFPKSDGGALTEERDNAARTIIAALGLAAFTMSVHRGLDLRSRCVLEQREPAKWTTLGAHGKDFEVGPKESLDLLRDAVAAAQGIISWNNDALTLVPNDNLEVALKKSNCPPDVKSSG